MAQSTLVQDSNVESERTQFLIKHQEWEDDDPCEVEEIGAYDQVLRQRKGPVKNRDPQSPDKGIKKDQTPNPSRDPQSPDKGIKKDQTPTPSRDPQSADKGIKKNNTPTPLGTPYAGLGS
ncbi:hypothetical protein GDO86_014678 [Hymenochirus boettgeri]|uniref:Uncharacterized protein n=1 Tax=Hymenochirus boettgeri TaxID=247094 RepID=A0A8T2JUN0_9PIPI|nr:hypothetical protein GDO86_014678 [Hymenochirus boettgeri]